MVIQERRERPIQAVVLEQIFPRQAVEVPPDVLQDWLGDYGNIRHPDTLEPYRLAGVRLQGLDVVSFAGCYWYGSPWRTWHLYVGVSRGPGLRVERV